MSINKVFGLLPALLVSLVLAAGTALDGFAQTYSEAGPYEHEHGLDCVHAGPFAWGDIQVSAYGDIEAKRNTIVFGPEYAGLDGETSAAPVHDRLSAYGGALPENNGFVGDIASRLFGCSNVFGHSWNSSHTVYGNCVYTLLSSGTYEHRTDVCTFTVTDYEYCTRQNCTNQRNHTSKSYDGCYRPKP